MTGLVPNRFLFAFEIPLRHLPHPPPLTGELIGWDESFLLPDLGRLDGREPFGKVFMGWDESGLYAAVRVEGKRKPLKCDPEAFWESDHLRVCTNMREAPDVRRATRYCRQFYFLPTGGGPTSEAPAAGINPFQRAKEPAPPANPSLLKIASRINAAGYTLEVHIPAKCLHGFDPSEHRRIGLYYTLEDAELGQQFLTIGDDLLWYVDPSTWATAVLTD